MNKIRFLSGNMLKIIAAIFMVIDHVGHLFFPNLMILRIIGRLSFPIFALMIAEGAKYTKNKLNYFLSIFILGVICQIVYYFVDNHSLNMNVLITFSMSLLMIYLFQFIKYLLFNTKVNKIFKITVSLILSIGSVTGLWFLCKVISFDYRFWGIMTPLLASLFDFKGYDVNDKLKKLDNYYLKLVLMEIGVGLLTIGTLITQIYGVLSFFILIFYSEKRGKLKMKYFFYLFYPLHLVFLYGLFMLLQIL